eukprot:277863-Pleurochrysis_carterae.AAC.1
MGGGTSAEGSDAALVTSSVADWVWLRRLVPDEGGSGGEKVEVKSADVRMKAGCCPAAWAAASASERRARRSAH